MTTHSGVAGLIVARCYPQMIPEDVTFPLVTFQVVSSDPYTQDRSGAERSKSRVQFNCYAATSDGAAALAAQVKSAWNGYTKGCDIGFALLRNSLETYNTATNIYRFIVDVLIEHPT